MGSIFFGFAFWRGKNPCLHLDGRGFVGKDSIAFWGEAREGYTLRKKTWLLPHVEKDSCVFQGEETFGVLPHVVKDSHIFRGKKVQILSHVEKDLWGRLAIYLEAKKGLGSFPM